MPHHCLVPRNGRPVVFNGAHLASAGDNFAGAKLYRTEGARHVVAYTHNDRPLHLSTFPDAASFGDAGLNDWYCATLARLADIRASFRDHEPALNPDRRDCVTVPNDRPWQPIVRFNGRRLARTAFQIHVSADHTDLYRTAGRQYITVSRIHNARINRWQVVHVDVYPTRKALIERLGYTQGAMRLYDGAGIGVTLHLP